MAAMSNLAQYHVMTPRKAEDTGKVVTDRWVLGGEYLEESLLDFCLHNVAGVSALELSRTTADGGWLSLGAIKVARLRRLRGPQDQQATARVMQRLDFMYGKMLKAAIQRSEAISKILPDLYLPINEVTTKPYTDRYSSLSIITFKARCPSTAVLAGYEVRYIKLVRFKEDGKASYFRLLRDSLIDSHVEARKFDQDSRILNPDNIRIPDGVIDNLVKSRCFFFLLNVRVWIDTCTQVLDWLHSNDAPKNISKLDPVYALEQTKKWHERNAYPIGTIRNLPDGSQEVKTREGWIPISQYYRSRTGVINCGRTLVDYIGTGVGKTALQTEDVIEVVELFGKRVEFLNPYVPAPVFSFAPKGPESRVEVTDADYRLIWQRENWTVVSLETLAAFQRESQDMRHCIGDTPRYYQRKCDPMNQYVALSLRKDGVPVGTFDYVCDRGIVQLKGAGNKALPIDGCVAFLQFLEDVSRIPVWYETELLVPGQDNPYGRLEKQMPIKAIMKDGRFHGSSYDVITYAQLKHVKNKEEPSINSILDLVSGKGKNSEASPYDPEYFYLMFERSVRDIARRSAQSNMNSRRYSVQGMEMNPQTGDVDFVVRNGRIGRLEGVSFLISNDVDAGDTRTTMYKALYGGVKKKNKALYGGVKKKNKWLNDGLATLRARMEGRNKKFVGGR